MNDTLSFLIILGLIVFTKLLLRSLWRRFR